VTLAAIFGIGGGAWGQGIRAEARGAQSPPAAGAVSIRVATFNLEDVRTRDLADRANPRLRRLAEVIQRVRPDVILLNEIAYDIPGAPDVPEGSGGGRNAQAFVDGFLARAQATDVVAMQFKAFTAQTNTGVHSGFDLDHDGRVTDEYPPPAPAIDGKPPAQSDEARAYGGDCWGFGTFPGQYAMALLVDERLEILTNQVRTSDCYRGTTCPGRSCPPARTARASGSAMHRRRSSVSRARATGISR
jgi:hypothetical protein